MPPRTAERRGVEAVRGLYGMVDDGRVPLDLAADVAVVLADAGCTAIQLRLKAADDRGRLDVQREAAAKLAGRGVLLVVNDRPDLAAVLCAEAPPGVRPGLHLGQDDLAPEDARRVVGQGVVIGLSTHDLEQVRAAADAPVDYLGFGPVFPTTTKANPDPAVGLRGLEEAVAASARPVVAIGGITPSRLPAVHAVGPAAAAMVAGLYGDVDLASPVALVALLQRARTLVGALR